MANYPIETGNQLCRVHLPARLDTLTTPEVQELLDQQDNSIRFIIFDFSDCTYLSSNGIRLLVLNRRKMAARQGVVLLCSLNPDVQNVLRMAGMLDLFAPSENIEQAMQKVDQLRGLTHQNLTWENHNVQFHFEKQHKHASAVYFSGPTLASLQELGFSFGMGPIGVGDKDAMRQIFVTTPGSIGGYAEQTGEELDYQLPADPVEKAVALDFAISFPMSESGRLCFAPESWLSREALGREMDNLQDRLGNGRAVGVMLLIKEKTSTGFSLSLLIRLNSAQLPAGFDSPVAWPSDNDWLGFSYLLEEWQALPGENICRQLEVNLNYENIISFGGYQGNEIHSGAEISVFFAYPNQLKMAERLGIESNQSLSLQAEFLVRKLYTDAASVLVEGLHGGYSAQTFQVASFDRDRRRMRPTVMKIANKAIIAREADRCKQYALPYIFNNSAIVLGAQFLDELGALRYNFVGVGGENSKLKWLTHYYHEKNPDFLIPVFNKIFQTILKPWYGQAVSAEIFPFKDHDPTTTFFPHIYSIAVELFGISSDDPHFIFPETGEKMLNPYWFLKHEFTRLRDFSIKYYSGICHGDLNMQNILLDENFNVYLIDFSETRPRSIISDFARLEAIFLIDNAPVETNAQLTDYVNFLKKWYASEDLEFDFSSENAFAGDSRFEKNLSLSKRMRNYAVQSAKNETNALAYYFALLEWILPIICYTVALPQKKCALAASSILCSRIQSKLNIKYD